MRGLFLEILMEAKAPESPVDWDDAFRSVERSETWPGRAIHLYISLAILKKEWRLDF